MNLLLLKQLAILSAFIGGIFGFAALLAPLTLWVGLALFVLPAVIIIVYLKKNDLIGIINTREGAIWGSVIGVVSLIASFVVFAPLSLILSWIFRGLFKISYTPGFLALIPFDFGSIVLLIICVLFLAFMSALFNGFSGLVTAYVYELITGMKKEADENNSIDFEIK